MYSDDRLCPATIVWVETKYCYGVASDSRIDLIIGLFCKKPYKRDNILQKRPIIWSILLTVATPYL